MSTVRCLCFNTSCDLPAVSCSNKISFCYCMQDKPNVLMLAVVNGNQDSEMQHAQTASEEVDPRQLRTITVYTKMDEAPADGHAW